MTKYLKRLAARAAREALRESAKEGKNWIVTKGLILEAEDENGDVAELEFQPGDVAEIGSTEDGDMAVKSSAAVVVISDPEIAEKIADTVVSSDELSDVKFVDRPALDAVMDGEDTEEVVDKIADAGNENDDIEVAEVEVDKKESVQSKFKKFANHTIHSSKVLTCEAVRIDEEHDAPINMAVIKADRVMVESYEDYSKFSKRVSELKGSLQPGEKEVALSESGKVIGSFDKAASFGKLFLENEFDSVEDMDAFSTEPEMLEQDIDLEMEATPEDFAAVPEEEKNIAREIYAMLMQNPDKYESDAEFAKEIDDRLAAAPAVKALVDRPEEDIYTVTAGFVEDQPSIEEKVEACLKGYEESAKSGEDYMKLVKGLERANLKESVIKTIAGSFNDRSLKECVRCFDSKYGMFVKTFTESVDCDNFIEETKEAKRFTKRFFG